MEKSLLLKQKTKVKKEKAVVDVMISIYCKSNHKSKSLCKDCQNLQLYVHTKIDRCPFKPEKTYCSTCHIHCYSKIMQEKIKQVMRYSGPRMIFYHPIILIDHWLMTLKFKFRKYRNIKDDK